MNITKLQREVYRAYQENPQVADDDALLLATVWGKDWDNSKSLYENLKYLPRAESLTRRRRELHEKGLIKYREDILKEREDAFRNEREMHGTPRVY